MLSATRLYEYFNSTKVQFGDLFRVAFLRSIFISIPLRYNLEIRERRAEANSPPISIPLRYNLERLSGVMGICRPPISIPLRYNLESWIQASLLASSAISIPLRYNLEIRKQASQVAKDNFNSTKVQFGAPNWSRASRLSYFNSTKVQFGVFNKNWAATMFSISIPLRYNLENT